MVYFVDSTPIVADGLNSDPVSAVLIIGTGFNKSYLVASIVLLFSGRFRFFLIRYLLNWAMLGSSE